MKKEVRKMEKAAAQLEEKVLSFLHLPCVLSGYLRWNLEYIRKRAVRLLRLREQHTPPRSVIVIVVSLQLIHFLIHTHGGKLAII